MSDKLHLAWGDKAAEAIYYEGFDISHGSATGLGIVTVAEGEKHYRGACGSVDMAVYNNNMYIAWVSAIRKELHFAKSTDDGATWSAVTTVATARGGALLDGIHTIRIDVDRLGKIFIAWTDFIWSTERVYTECSYSSDVGATWATTDIYDDAESDICCHLVIDSDENIYVFTEHEDGIYCFKSTDHGASFGSGVEALAGMIDGSWSWRFYADIDEADDIFFTCRFHDYGVVGSIFLERCWISQDGGVSFSGPYIVSDTRPDTGPHPKVMATEGHIYCFWLSDSERLHHFYTDHSTDGETWATDVLVDDQGVDAYYDSARAGGIGADGIVYFIWRDSLSFKMRTSNDNGASWSDPITLYTGAHEDQGGSAIISVKRAMARTYFFLA